MAQLRRQKPADGISQTRYALNPWCWAIARDIYRPRGQQEPVLAELMGPLTAAVGYFPHFRVNFSEAGPGIWLGRDREEYPNASAI